MLELAGRVEKSPQVLAIGDWQSQNVEETGRGSQ